jgi:hypothetical protein
MCRKAKCAYLRKNGYCLIHKAMCNIAHFDAKCQDGVERAIPSKDRSFWKCLGSWELNTAKGRFAFMTRNVRGHAVYRTCSRKRRFASLYDAKEQARELLRHKGRDLLAYECPFCGGYHLTHHKRHNLMVLNGVV